jgi:hypothetical protein
MAVGTGCGDHVTRLYPQKLALTASTSDGCSIDLVRLWTKSHGVVLYLVKKRIRENCTEAYHYFTNHGNVVISRYKHLETGTLCLSHFFREHLRCILRPSKYI